jgi:hypothetical protein
LTHLPDFPIELDEGVVNWVIPVNRAAWKWIQFNYNRVLFIGVSYTIHKQYVYAVVNLLSEPKLSPNAWKTYLTPSSQSNETWHEEHE